MDNMILERRGQIDESSLLKVLQVNYHVSKNSLKKLSQ